MKTMLVALLLLAVGTGTAFGECAWVVWSIWPGVDEDKWLPVDSYTKPEPCKEDAHRRETSAVKQRLKLSFVCLPDTVGGPRGPKGK